MNDTKHAPPFITHLTLRDELAEARVARQQAEDAQKVAEEQARRAEERSTTAEEERDGWAGFAHALADEHLISWYADDRLTDDMRRGITECLYDEWSTGTPVDDLSVEPVVNGYNEAIR